MIDCVTLLPHIVRLRPAPHCRTPILSYSLRVLPEPHFLNWQQDPYSNFLARLVFLKPAREFRVQVDLIAEMTAINPFDFFVEPAVEQLSVQVRRRLGPRTGAVPGNGRGRAQAPGHGRRSCAARTFAPSIFWWKSIASCSSTSAM